MCWSNHSLRKWLQSGWCGDSGARVSEEDPRATGVECVCGGAEEIGVSKEVSEAIGVMALLGCTGVIGVYVEQLCNFVACSLRVPA